MSQNYSKVIFVSEGRDFTNHERLKSIISKYNLIYPDDVFGNLAPFENSIDAINRRTTIISRCDAILFCGNWEETQQCQLDYSFAIGKGMKILTTDDTDFVTIDNIQEEFRKYLKNIRSHQWTYEDMKSEFNTLNNKLRAKYHRFINRDIEFSVYPDSNNNDYVSRYNIIIDAYIRSDAINNIWDMNLSELIDRIYRSNIMEEGTTWER